MIRHKILSRSQMSVYIFQRYRRQRDPMKHNMCVKTS